MGSRDKNDTSPESEGHLPRGKTPRPGGRFRRGLGLPGWLLVGLGLVSAQACANDPPLVFPIYPPTAPFLENQERVRTRAEANRAFRGSARVRNVARFRSKTLAAWEPIYSRIRAAEGERQIGNAADLSGRKNRARQKSMDRKIQAALARRAKTKRANQ